MSRHEIIRETFRWGTYGVNGDEPLRFIVLKDITNSHLEALIPFARRNLSHYGVETLKTFLDELEYRKTHKIKVPFLFGR